MNDTHFSFSSNSDNFDKYNKRNSWLYRRVELCIMWPLIGREIKLIDSPTKERIRDLLITGTAVRANGQWRIRLMDKSFFEMNI